MDEMEKRKSDEKPDEKAFEKAIVEYRERIYLMLLKYVRNKEDALDLTQDAFIRAYNSLDSFRGDSGLYTWIYRIAVNLAINFKTRDKFAGIQSIDDNPVISHTTSAYDDMEKKELSESIDKAVQTLPNRQRMVFVLRYYEEKPYSEISDMLGITEGAAKANYHQAIKKLKKNLEPYLKGE